MNPKSFEQPDSRRTLDTGLTLAARRSSSATSRPLNQLSSPFWSYDDRRIWAMGASLQDEQHMHTRRTRGEMTSTLTHRPIETPLLAPSPAAPADPIVARPVGLVQATQALDPVTLSELDQAQLHDRVESKVILADRDLPAAIARLANHYRVMEHQDERFQHYRNDYFDTHDLRNYHEHHNRNGRRIKVRYRTYANSDLTFFEVKRSVHGRTVKERRKSELPVASMLRADAAFFFRKTGWRPSLLHPSVSISYDRILLVKRDFSERVTIDINLRYVQNGVLAETPGLAICEFKQPRLDLRSPAMEALDRHPQMFSKYCMGIASCDPSLRRNRFKKVFRNLDAIGASPTTRRVVNI